MKTSKIKKADGKVILEVTASADDVNKAFALAELDFANSMGINPEPGKTIEQIAEEKMGIKNLDSIIEANALEALAPMAIDKSGIVPAFPPRPTPSTALKRNQDFSFTLEVSPKPEYELTSYDPVEITLPPFAINEAEVDGNAPERPEACEQVMVFLSEGFAAHEDSRVETAMCQGVRMRQLLRDAVSFRPAPLPR